MKAEGGRRKEGASVAPDPVRSPRFEDREVRLRPPVVVVSQPPLRATFRASRITFGSLWPVGLAAALLLGAGLRLIWGADIEYKLDEAWTFQQTQRGARTEPFPWLGMPSSTRVLNPGMSVWVFLLLGRVGGAETPADLARAVQLVNVAALVLLIAFALRWVSPAERELWLWAAALAAVNPLAVLFQRKIWPPSVLPLLSVVLLMGWWGRHRRGGAFLWGLVGACLGQIHMAGFFFAAALAGWALAFDRRRVAWRGWLAGSGFGAIFLVPWVYYLLTGPGQASHVLHWTRPFGFKFWTHWLTEPFGLGLRYALGPDFGDFLSYPLLAGQPTYLVGLLHGLLVVLGVVILARAGRRFWQQQRWRDLWVGGRSSTAFAVNAALWGFGVLLTVPGLAFYRHYLIVAFPLTFVWLTRLALGDDPAGSRKLGRGLLATLCVTQALVTVCFLGYVHVNQAALRGDYGVPYGAQIQEPITRPSER